MKPKLSEIDKLKYWIDSEFSVLHIMFAIIMLQLTKGWFPTLILSIYIFITLIYILARMALIASIDKDYLRLPKK